MPATMFYSEEEAVAIAKDQEKELFSIGSQARRLSGVYCVFGRLVCKYRGATVADVTNNIRAGAANLIVKFMRCSERNLRTVSLNLFLDPTWVAAGGKGTISGEIRDGLSYSVVYFLPLGIVLQSCLTSNGMFTVGNDRYEKLPGVMAGGGNRIGPCRLFTILVRNNFDKVLEVSYQFHIVKYPG
ncbi:MAG: hypothetical protein QXY15_10720 [Candidatus Nitrosotenuis sp.]